MGISRYDTEALYRARKNQTFMGGLEAGSGLSSQTVMNNGNIGSAVIQSIPNGSAAVITNMYMHLRTVSDNLEAEVGYTSDAAGTGTFTPLGFKFRLETGSEHSGVQPHLITFPVPFYVKGSDAGAVTLRVKANDDAAIVDVGLSGWMEQE